MSEIMTPSTKNKERQSQTTSPPRKPRNGCPSVFSPHLGHGDLLRRGERHDRGAAERLRRLPRAHRGPAEKEDVAAGALRLGRARRAPSRGEPLRLNLSTHLGCIFDKQSEPLGSIFAVRRLRRLPPMRAISPSVASVAGSAFDAAHRGFFEYAVTSLPFVSLARRAAERKRGRPGSTASRALAGGDARIMQVSRCWCLCIHAYYT